MNFKEYLKEDETVAITIAEGFIGDTVKKYANKIGVPAYLFMLIWQYEKEKTVVIKSIKDYAESIDKDSDEYELVLSTFDSVYNSLSDSKLKKTVETLKSEFES